MQNSVYLTVKQGYSFKAAFDSLGIDVTTLRVWYRKFAAPPEAVSDDVTSPS
ncbi:hypothetical protein [Rhodopirellula sp. P2]|uniref:hypothetical protein n=1 Tax=Rhodopirellula sp. P2 TaxID=2127060 RepID=UPI002368E8C8|nr:hypothetical protein [Rhodopirellula sp. P2]WDQ18902.1 hypothetical protein PSR62_10240 [Rhodopirellula sp. P2]